jgi:outer membrane biosynthesis protein TonB
MGVRNRSKETLDRLAAKTLDARFFHEIEHGLNCSPFEGESVLQVVKEVLFPFLDGERALAPPGKVTLIAIATGASQPMPEAPVEEPETEPSPAPAAPPPEPKPDLDPFNPDWPEQRPEPRPKA